MTMNAFADAVAMVWRIIKEAEDDAWQELADGRSDTPAWALAAYEACNEILNKWEWCGIDPDDLLDLADAIDEQDAEPGVENVRPAVAR